MAYLIFGAGGVGGVIAGLLAADGHEVTVVARPAVVEAVGARGGLRVSGRVDLDPAPVTAVARVEDARIGPDTSVLLTMKSYDTAAALDGAAHLFAGRPVVSCQNGVANEDQIARRGLQAYGAVVVIGASVVEPGHVAYTSAGHVHLGCVPHGVDEACHRIATDLTSAGLDGRAVAETMTHKWAKLLRNLTNAYMGLVGASIAEVGRDEVHRSFCADVIEEALVVLRRAGIAYEPQGGSYDWWIAHKAGVTCERGDGTVEAEVADLRRPGTRTTRGPASYASTWQDLAAGRTRLEVGSFNGEIVRLGRQHGVPTPLNQILLDRVTDAAASQQGPGTETPASLSIHRPI